MANFPRGVGFLQDFPFCSIFCGQCAHLRVCIWVAGDCSPSVRVCVRARVLGPVQLLEAQPRGRRQLVARSPVPVLRVQLVQPK